MARRSRRCRRWTVPRSRPHPPHRSRGTRVRRRLPILTGVPALGVPRAPRPGRGGRWRQRRRRRAATPWRRDHRPGGSRRAIQCERGEHSSTPCPYPDTMLRDEVGRVAGNAVHATWEAVVRFGALGPRHRRARKFSRFGNGSLIAFPPTVIFGEGRIAVGEGSIIGPLASLSAGMPTQANLRGDPVITIGDRCMLGKGIGIVGHERIDIGNDIWTGHYVYVTDQNHGYEVLDLPIGTQMWKNEPVSVGDG